MDVGTLPHELRCAFESKLDRERRDQRSRGEGQHARQHLLRERNVETQHRAKDDRAGGGQAQHGDVEEAACTCDQRIFLKNASVSWETPLRHMDVIRKSIAHSYAASMAKPRASSRFPMGLRVRAARK